MSALDDLTEKEYSQMTPLERVIIYWFEVANNDKLAEQAVQELERLQAIAEAAKEVLSAFMVTDVWDDENATPAREEAVGDMTRDQKLEALAALLEPPK